MPAGRRRAAGAGRGAAGPGVGRGRRPVHHHREDHHRPAAGQARRPPADRDRPRQRLPHRRIMMAIPVARTAARARLRLLRRTARLRLTALYGGLFLACGAVLLAVTYLLVDQSTDPGSSSIPTQLVGPAAGPSARGQISLPAGVGSLQQISAAQAAAVNRVVRGVLGELLIQSPIALAIVTVVALALGWVVA